MYYLLRYTNRYAIFNNFFEINKKLTGNIIINNYI